MLQTRPIFRRVRKIAKSDYLLCHVCPSAWNNSAPTGRIFIRFCIWVFYENLSIKFKIYENRAGVKGTVHEDQFTFFKSYFAHLFLEWEMFQTEVLRKIKTHFAFSNILTCICLSACYFVWPWAPYRIHTWRHSGAIVRYWYVYCVLRDVILHTRYVSTCGSGIVGGGREQRKQKPSAVAHVIIVSFLRVSVVLY
jgi:hypothetical protein